MKLQTGEETTISEDIGAGIGRELSPVIQNFLDDYRTLLTTALYMSIAGSVVLVYVGYTYYKKSA